MYLEAYLEVIWGVSEGLSGGHLGVYLAVYLEIIWGGILRSSGDVCGSLSGGPGPKVHPPLTFV